MHKLAAAAALALPLSLAAGPAFAGCAGHSMSVQAPEPAPVQQTVQAPGTPASTVGQEG